MSRINPKLLVLSTILVLLAGACSVDTTGRSRRSRPPGGALTSDVPPVVPGSRPEPLPEADRDSGRALPAATARVDHGRMRKALPAPDFRQAV